VLSGNFQSGPADGGPDRVRILIGARHQVEDFVYKSGIAGTGKLQYTQSFVGIERACDSEQFPESGPAVGVQVAHSSSRRSQALASFRSSLTVVIDSCIAAAVSSWVSPPK